MNDRRFSLSIFTIEIDGKPTLAFKAKKHSEADAICEDKMLRAKLGLLKSGDVPCAMITRYWTCGLPVPMKHLITDK